MRISTCHCLKCQRRTGAVISNQARFRREQVTFAGRLRTADSGNAETFVRNHMEGITSIDLFVVPTITFQQLFAFLVLGHERRRLLCFAVNLGHQSRK